MEFGDKGDEFFIIMQGLVSVQIPNKAINDWYMYRKDYKWLKEWKKNEFDPKAKKAELVRMESY